MADPLDLTEFVRPGDTVLWGSGTAEPTILTEALVNQRHRLGGVTVVVGAMFSRTFRPEHADALRFVGLGGLGTASTLCRAGVMEILPVHLGALPALIESGRLPVDVVLVQVTPPGTDGRCSLGLAADYLQAALRSARVVLAETNPAVPFTFGDTLVDPTAFSAVVESDRSPLTVETPDPGPTERAIAALVAERIPDGAVLQMGIGAVPTAVVSLLGARDLGIHSGLVNDGVLGLIESGAVTNARKELDPGLTVTGVLYGSERLYRWADRNPDLVLRPVSYTHDPVVLASFGSLFAINSAVEVDLTGQINAEVVDGRHVGAVGGLAAFARAAASSPRGRAVTVLPSTAGSGTRSRIVPALAGGVATVPRSDADLVVTEHGVADLRGVSLAERARRLVAVADPAQREWLAGHASALC